ncbi:sensor histidine kinase [Nonomuraea sp. SBT364]|uniref:sensor histidine kinase n=1 Tax=Nonomuraea sp. SBT364 TaxID=1580530 RepID=UPI000A5642B6|nr:histidine kinase [Nonomuraea sp. SBT364]
MHERADHQPPLTREGVALRYLCAVLPMLFYGATLVWVTVQHPGRLPSVLVDAGLGVAGLVLMRWRRRWPWPIALATALLTAFSTVATGPAQVAYVSLCTHRRWREIVPVASVSWLCLAVGASWSGINQATAVTLVTGTFILGGLTVFGLYLRSRRDLEASLREADLSAEREQPHRIEQAKLAERVKIAQEMHDVLAHRISLLTMLAGGLAYRTDLTPEETRRTALAIQENAHQSMNELRAVLGTLRRDGALEAPQPTLAQVEALIAEVRSAGQRVDVDDTIERRDLLPAQTGRHAYRIVQEALTNARKHAPAGRVTAELSGRPGAGLRITVSNPAPPATAGPPPPDDPAVPGHAPPHPVKPQRERLGLVGLAERARMAGGTITHTVRDGRFILDAHLPWEA